MKRAANSKHNQVRIIGGEWRGRKLEFPTVQGLRPTPDRVRETLFNWLQPYLPGSRCLDLFAGTGVLGFEAASRGAANATLIERDSSVYRALEHNVDKLDASARVALEHRDALQYLQRGCQQQFDIIFIDPPYGKDLVAAAIAAITRSHCLKAGGLVYMEHESDADAPVLPENWLELKHKRAGQVSYYLLRLAPTLVQAT